MAGRKTRLTKELIEQVCNLIKAGAFDYVSCEAVGISQQSFYSWLNDAQLPDADLLKIEFSESIEAAKAIARASAEITVRRDKPEVWLMRGPGKNKLGREGWSAENVLTLQVGNQPLQLTWDDSDETAVTNTIAETARITTDSEG